MALLVDIWTQTEIIPQLRNVKEKIVRERRGGGRGREREREKEIISLQIKCYTKIFSLSDQVYGSYSRYYIDIIAVGFTQDTI